MPRKVVDLLGVTVGKLTVIAKTDKRIFKSVVWLCSCACGNTREVTSKNLQRKGTISCGCYNRHDFCGYHIHGLSYTNKFRMHAGAKARAKRKGLDFELELEDIVIPDVCPVLGIPLVSSVGRVTGNSPTIDRFDNSLGYTKDNIRVISYRANRIKVDASIEEVEKILSYMKGELK